MNNTIQMIIFANTIRNIFQWGAQSSLSDGPGWSPSKILEQSNLLLIPSQMLGTWRCTVLYHKSPKSPFQDCLSVFPVRSIQVFPSLLVTGYTANEIIKELYLFMLRIKCFGLKNRAISTCDLKNAAVSSKPMTSFEKVTTFLEWMVKNKFQLIIFDFLTLFFVTSQKWH